MTTHALIPVAVTALAFAASPARASHAHHVVTSRCTAAHRSVLAIDPEAQVYDTKQGENLTYRGCVFGEKRSFVLGGPLVCGGGSTGSCGGMRHYVLAGKFVAYEEVTIDEQYGESPEDEWIVVRNLSNGHTIHRIPTGSALRPSPTYVGVGEIVALVLKSNGSAAWVANDYERAVGVGTLQHVPYFDVWAVDQAGARQLAAGTDIDPSSLALAVGATQVGREDHSGEGTSVFWTQARQPFSAPLN